MPWIILGEWSTLPGLRDAAGPAHLATAGGVSHAARLRDAAVARCRAATTLETVRPTCAFTAGAAGGGSRHDARFALISEPGSMPPLRAFDLGTDEFPDRSTTLDRPGRGAHRRAGTKADRPRHHGSRRGSKRAGCRRASGGRGANQRALPPRSRRAPHCGQPAGGAAAHDRSGGLSHVRGGQGRRARHRRSRTGCWPRRGAATTDGAGAHARSDRAAAGASPSTA